MRFCRRWQIAVIPLRFPCIYVRALNICMFLCAERSEMVNECVRVGFGSCCVSWIKEVERGASSQALYSGKLGGWVRYRENHQCQYHSSCEQHLYCSDELFVVTDERCLGQSRRTKRGCDDFNAGLGNAS